MLKTSVSKYEVKSDCAVEYVHTLLEPEFIQLRYCFQALGKAYTLTSKVFALGGILFVRQFAPSAPKSSTLLRSRIPSGMNIDSLGEVDR
jgi:hypothetical protein